MGAEPSDPPFFIDDIYCSEVPSFSFTDCVCVCVCTSVCVSDHICILGCLLNINRVSAVAFKPGNSDT